MSKKQKSEPLKQPNVMGSAFDESKPCYCTLCERTYKNYARFKIHMLKKHYP
jgi:hypothetical protein